MELVAAGEKCAAKPFHGRGHRSDLRPASPVITLMKELIMTMVASSMPILMVWDLTTVLKDIESNRYDGQVQCTYVAAQIMVHAMLM